MFLCGVIEDGMVWDFSLKMFLISLCFCLCNMFVSVLVFIIVQMLLEVMLFLRIIGSLKIWKIMFVRLLKNYISGV